ncbi:retrovirus-related pol polyprotein from transposon TNT 1-94 [Tanacetum coccineum]
MSNTNNNLQIQTSNALHNAIMEAGGKDRPSMLAPGNYVQWKSRIKRYIDTKPNNELIHYCLQNPPYKFKWTEKTVPVAEGSSETTTEGYMENYKNVSQDIRDQLNAEAEVVQIILTGIDNDIYSTVDACPNAYEMWKAIERLKQGESINVQDLETNFYWEFGKFTSRDSESLESYYSRFVTFVKQSQELKTVFYHKLYDILKQHQNEVNEIRAEILARSANPLALKKSNCNSSAPIYDQEPATVTEDDKMSKEKEIDKLMALISLSFKKIYKPTNNNLRTSSNTSRANQDNSPRINRGTGYENQRVVNVAGARDNVGTQVVQKSRIQCYSCKEYGHVSRECHKLKRAKDAAYHKEKMILCKQEEAGVQLNAEQADWKDDTDDESNDLEYVHGTDSRGTVKFGNDQIAPILGYGDLVQGIITIKRVYYVEGLNHNLFSVGQFCDADLEVAFRKSTCYIRDLKGNDLLTGSRGTDMYSITLQETSTPNPICSMAKATSSQAWLWHRRLSHLNFDTINLLSKNNIVTGLPKLKFIKDHLCSSCELGKAKRKSFHTKTTPSSKRRLQLLHMDLCVPCGGLHAQVRTVRTNKGMEFLNKTLHAYFAKEGIRHETSTVRTPEQKGVVERQNRTLVEAARTMLSAAKVPLVFNKRTRVIVETIHVNFDELPQMALDHVSSDPVTQCPTTILEQGSLSPSPQSQGNVPQAAETVTTSNELDLLFSLMFDELLNGTTPVVSKSSIVHAADTPNKRQQHNTSTTTVAADAPPLNIQTTPETTSQAPTQAPTVNATENINQAETNKENAHVKEEEFINIFSTPEQEQGETSSRHVDSSNMHTFYQ